MLAVRSPNRRWRCPLVSKHNIFGLREQNDDLVSEASTRPTGVVGVQGAAEIIAGTIVNGFVQLYGYSSRADLASFGGIYCMTTELEWSVNFQVYAPSDGTLGGGFERNRLDFDRCRL